MSEVFFLDGKFRVCYEGRVLSSTWKEKGLAHAALGLLLAGKAEVTPHGTFSWKRTDKTGRKRFTHPRELWVTLRRWFNGVTPPSPASPASAARMSRLPAPAPLDP